MRSSHSPHTATQIARELNINPSTCFNILQTLIDEDFVWLDERNRTYSLSLGVVALARTALEQNSLLRSLEPKLRAFARSHGVLAAVLRKVNDERSIMVAVAESDTLIHLNARIGSSTPLLLGAAGRVFAAHGNFSPEEMKARFSELRLARPLPFEVYEEQVAEVLNTGWALDDGYFLPGTVSVAAPVFEPLGGVTLCASAIMFNTQHDARRIAMIADELVAIGRSPMDQPGTGSSERSPDSVRAITTIAR
jgi:DNA-binding IclR family transcriptional regulator